MTVPNKQMATNSKRYGKEIQPRKIGIFSQDAKGTKAL